MSAAGLFRRLAAMLYDTLLALAVLMVAVAAWLPFSQGEAIADQGGVARTLMQFWILVVTFVFFAGFWTHGGQTLGMKAWRLQLLREDGASITWPDAARRFTWAIPSLGLAGLGLWWMVIDKERRALHDRLSRTRMVLLPKPPK